MKDGVLFFTELTRPRAFRVAASLCPEDPEIMFNYAATLEASTSFFSSGRRIAYSRYDPAGNLEQALEKYQLSKKYGVERAAVHIRNVSPSPINASTTGLTYGPQVGAKILAKQVKETEKSGNPKSEQ